MSDQCELCSHQSNEISSRVFPCLYHCKKMLCIQHLAEHDQYIDKQIQYQKQLNYLWKDYHLMFDEEKVQEELQRLRSKLEKYRILKREIDHLLLINHFHDSIENNQKFQRAIKTIEKAIEDENQSNFVIRDINPKIEADMNDEEENQTNIDNSSPSVSATTNDGSQLNFENREKHLHFFESETIESSPSLSNIDGNWPLEDEYLQSIDDSEDQETFTDVDNEEQISLKGETNITPPRNITASTVRGYCPLTHDGAFGIKSHLHGIRLCPHKTGEKQRTYFLNAHFRRAHHLTSLAALALTRAISSGQDPMSTRLFSDHHIILNLDELRTVTCPINKPFFHYPSLQIDNTPCGTIKQIRHLRDHLKRAHRFTNKAATLIVKSVKTDVSVHKIQFPQWINILENENHI